MLQHCCWNSGFSVQMPRFKFLFLLNFMNFRKQISFSKILTILSMMRSRWWGPRVYMFTMMAAMCVIHNGCTSSAGITLVVMSMSMVAVMVMIMMSITTWHTATLRTMRLWLITRKSVVLMASASLSSCFLFLGLKLWNLFLKIC